MDIIESLVGFFKKPAEETKDTAPEGICSLCWGHQQYDHKIRQLFSDKQVDINNHQKSYTLIKDFVVNRIDGIKLQQGATASCPSCGSCADTDDSQSKLHDDAKK